MVIIEESGNNRVFVSVKFSNLSPPLGVKKKDAENPDMWRIMTCQFMTPEIGPTIMLCCSYFEAFRRKYKKTADRRSARLLKSFVFSSFVQSIMQLNGILLSSTLLGPLISSLPLSSSTVIILARVLSLALWSFATN